MQQIKAKNGRSYLRYSAFPDCNKPISAKAFSQRKPENKVNLCASHLKHVQSNIWGFKV